jgi:ribonuclease R
MDALRDRAPRAMHIMEITGQIGLPKSRKEAVAHVLDQLIELGMVREMPGRRFRLMGTGRKQRGGTFEGQRPIPTGQRLEGYVSVHPRGFAFVAAEDGGPDVFLPPHALGAALHGDRVEVVTRPSPRGREGDVVAIHARRPPRITGTLRYAGSTPLFEPDDYRLRTPMAVEGDIPAAAKPGQAVVADIVRYPQHADDQAGVTVRDVLGAQGLTRVEVEKIKIRENVVEDFPAAVREEAQQFGGSVPGPDKKSREDLRDLDLVTIDPEDARDHDDALFAERRPKGGFRIVIAIADVSHYVRPGSAIDEEATARATSIYLPDRAIPMLPPELSSNLASLVAKKDRLCLAVDVELTSRGTIHRYRFVEGLMRSGAGLTYEGVARALGLTDEGPRQKEADARLPMLEALLEASRVLRQRRMHRGALDFDLPEARAKLNAEGEPIDVVRSRQDPGVREAYRLVEEMMLLANEVVAADLTERVVPAIYRIHGKPDEGKVELFCQLAASLGYDLSVDSAQDPRELSSFLRRIEGTPQADTLRYLLLRSMQQAMYGVDPTIGHFGLAAKDYLHFTSPIRRYPDLAVHRVVRSVIRGEHVDAAMLSPRLRKMAAQSSRLERRAMTVERDVLDLYRAILMRDRVGEEFDATVSGIDGSGIYVTFDAPFVDAFMPLDRLDDDDYSVDDLGIRLSGARTGKTYTLGDKIRVHLLDVNVQRRELVAVPLELLARSKERDATKGEPRDGGRSRPAGRPKKPRGDRRDSRRASPRAERGSSRGKGAGSQRAAERAGARKNAAKSKPKKSDR